MGPGNHPSWACVFCVCVCVCVCLCCKGSMLPGHVLWMSQHPWGGGVTEGGYQAEQGLLQLCDSSLLSVALPFSLLIWPCLWSRHSKIDKVSLKSQSNPSTDWEITFEDTVPCTETALLRVLNDLLLAADSGSPVVLVLLDLTAAFDTVDHRVLLSRLKHIGIKGTALQFFSSYLTNRSFSVQLGEFTSSSAAPLPCGVPQGSILGPILFLIYILPLGDIMKIHNISFHCFADDVQLYLPFKTDDQAPPPHPSSWVFGDF